MEVLDGAEDLREQALDLDDTINAESTVPRSDLRIGHITAALDKDLAQITACAV